MHPGPATLYTTLQRLLDLGLIATAESPSGVDERRRYRLTGAGRQARNGGQPDGNRRQKSPLTSSETGELKVMRSHLPLLIPRVYAMLLVLFPRSFTDEFGYEMVSDFCDACLRARHSRGSTRPRLALGPMRLGFGPKRRHSMGAHRRAFTHSDLSSWTLLLFSLLALQGIPQASVLFTKLHFAWLLIAISMGLLCFAFGRTITALVLILIRSERNRDAMAATVPANRQAAVD